MTWSKARGFAGGCVCVAALLAFNAESAFGQNCAGSVNVACGSTSAAQDNCAGDEVTAVGSCNSGPGVTGVYFDFVADADTARLQTRNNPCDTVVSFAGCDSSFVVYSVDQGNMCDESAWVEVGCSEDDCFPDCVYNGDISIGGLTVGDTYLVQLTSWSDGACGEYAIELDCPSEAPGVTCGDGIVSPIGDEECDGEVNGTCSPFGGCNPDCTCIPIPVPALPVWALATLPAMLLTGGAVIFGRRRVGRKRA